MEIIKNKFLDIFIRYGIIIIGYIISSTFTYIHYYNNIEHLFKFETKTTIDSMHLVRMFYIFFLWNISGFFYIAIISPIIGIFKPTWSNIVLFIIVIHFCWFFIGSFEAPTINWVLMVLCVVPAITAVAIALKLKIRTIL